MKKIGLVLTAILSFSTFTSAEMASSVKSPLEVLQKTPKWGLIQSGISCIEYYQFLPSGEVLIESNKQRVTGTYSYLSKPTQFELPAVKIKFLTDNQQPDCAGNTDNQAGTSTTNFLKKESDQKIFFCLDALGKQCPVYLRPVK